MNNPKSKRTAATIVAMLAAILLIDPVCRTTVSLFDGDPNVDNEAILVSSYDKPMTDLLLETFGFIEFETDYLFTRLSPQELSELIKRVGYDKAKELMISSAIGPLKISNQQKAKLTKAIKSRFKKLALTSTQSAVFKDKKSHKFTDGLKELGYSQGATSSNQIKPNYNAYVKDLANGKVSMNNVISAGEKAKALSSAKTESDEPAAGGPEDDKPKNKNRDAKTEKFVINQHTRIFGANSVGKDYSLRFSPKPGDKTVYFVSNIHKREATEDKPASIKSTPKMGSLDLMRGTWYKDGGKIKVKDVKKVPGLNDKIKFGFDIFYSDGKITILYTGFPANRMKIFRAVSTNGTTFIEAGPVAEFNELGKNVGHITVTNNGNIAAVEVDKNIFIARRKGKAWADFRLLDLEGDSKINLRIMPEVYTNGSTHYIFYRNQQTGLHAAKLRDLKVVGLSKVSFKGQASKYLTINQGIAGLGLQVFGSKDVSDKTGLSQSFDIYQLRLNAQKEKVETLPSI